MTPTMRTIVGSITEEPGRKQMTRLKTESFAVLLIMALFEFSGPDAIGLIQTPRPRQRTETWRNRAPKADSPRAFKLPATHTSRLDNGLTLVLIEDHRSPVVTIVVGIPTEISPSRDISELTRQVALVEATAQLITEGAGSRNSEQLAREVETLGGRLSSSANDDYAEVSVSVVAENAERMMDLLGDVLLRPTFPETEVALYKRNRIQNLTVQRQDPGFLAGEQFDRIIFGSHPYGISAPTPSAVDALDRDKIALNYKSSYSPEGAIAVIVGDFDANRMEMKASEALASWKTPRKKPTEARGSIEFSQSSVRRVCLIDRAGSEQATFRVGQLAVKRSDADYFPLLVANAILGAGTNSRLFLNIRERKGYAYDVSSSVGSQREGGTFFAIAETRTEVTVSAIREVLVEFDRLRNAQVQTTELQSAKNYLNGLFSLVLSTQGGVAERILQTYMLDLGRDYLSEYRARIEAVTAEQVQAAARKYIRSEASLIVVVGDAAKLAAALREIAPVEMLDAQGKPVKQAAL
jgi:zinc protease